MAAGTARGTPVRRASRMKEETGEDLPGRIARAFRPSFPPAEDADAEGLVAVGGDLSVPRLLEAYRRGIFPWYEEGEPIGWWSPDPRLVLEPGEFRVSRSLRATI